MYLQYGVKYISATTEGESLIVDDAVTNDEGALVYIEHNTDQGGVWLDLAATIELRDELNRRIDAATTNEEDSP
jgi:hypothetical protein